MNEYRNKLGAMACLVCLMATCGLLGFLGERVARRSSFLRGFFTADKGLGVWALALTTTIQSGGTFMGFPGLVYAFGWPGALFIASYMVVPITGFAIFGRRLVDLAKRTKAITVPDLFRTRFDSGALGVVSALMMIFLIWFSMSAQFKAGALVIKQCLPTEWLPVHNGVGWDRAYLASLIVFTLIVVSYTALGGFLASVWADLLQSVLMFLGVMLLLVLVLQATGGFPAATAAAAEARGPETLIPPGFKDDRPFMPLGLGFSFFFMWIFGGVGTPACMIRLMAARDVKVVRRGMMVLSVYNLGIYLPIIAICICAQAINGQLPVAEQLPVKQADGVIPWLAFHLARDAWYGPLLAGLILVAPFGAIMATVSTYLVVIAGSLVRDVYQTLIRPQAPDAELKWVSRSIIAALGVIGFLANINPPPFLQVLIVISGQVAGAAFVIPTAMACFSRRANAQSAMAAMLAGTATVILLYVQGLLGYGSNMGPPSATLTPLYLLGLDPSVWGILASLLAGIIGTMVASPPDLEKVAQFFD